MSGQLDLKALRSQAEDAAVWQDQWDTPSSDGTAVGDWLDTASPRLVLDLLDEIDRLKAMLGDLPRTLEAALTPTGDHHQLPDGYCLDCQGGCIVPLARENTEGLRGPAYAGPSPFGVKGGE